MHPKVSFDDALVLTLNDYSLLYSFYVSSTVG